jgi:hypothetical protein
MARIWRSSAAFRIGADISTDPPGALPDAKVVTVRLGIEPTSAHNPGDRQSPRAAPFKHGQWALVSALAKEADLDAHPQWLLERLLPARESIAEIVKADGRLRADFFCALYLKGINEGLNLTPRTLAGIGSLGAELGLDIYTK